MAVKCPYCGKKLAEVAFIGTCIRCKKPVSIDNRIKV